jgi:hypothetical protein
VTDLQTFTQAIQSSKVLREGTRAKLLAAAPRLKPAQWEAVLGLVRTAEQKYQALVQTTEAKKQTINRAHLEKTRDFVKHQLPKLVRDLETKDRQIEEKSIEKILSNLD